MAIPQILQRLQQAETQSAAVSQGNRVNPMIARINQAKQQAAQISNYLKSAADPDAVFQNMISQNPAMQQAMLYIQQNGGDPKTACEKLMRDNGLDTNLLK